MASKIATLHTGKTRAKKLRKSLSLAVKLDVIKRLERGERSKTVCTALNLASSTVHTIYKQKDKLIKMAETCFGGLKLTRVTKSRTSLMGKLESLLAHWIESHNHQNVPLSFSIIQEQALALFEDLKKEAEEEGTIGTKDMEFKASHGWFERFKNRVNLHNMRIGEDKISSVYDNIDTRTAKTFPQELQRIVEEGGYLPKQIFNVDEIGLYWKRLPSQTFIAREEKTEPGFKVSKEQITLLLGGNLDGECKLKPLLIYYFENPKSLKGLNKASLPVIWRSNKKACMQKEVFADYLTCYFSPFLASYFAKNKIDNKALLVIDNAPAHCIDVEDYADNIKVVFLPSSISQNLQPMDQGVTALFKAYYYHNVICHLVSTSDGDKPTIKALWKNYNIKMAIENISISWGKITQNNINSVWKNILPKYVYNFQGFVSVVKTVQKKIVSLAQEAGFYEVDQSGIQELFDSHSEDLTKEELIQMEVDKLHNEDEDNDETADFPMKTLDIKTLSEFFTTLEKAMKIIEENDPNLERSSVCRHKLMEDVQCYRQLFETKKKAVGHRNSLTLFQHQKLSRPQLTPSTVSPSVVLMEVDDKDFTYSNYPSDEAPCDSAIEDCKFSNQDMAMLAAIHQNHHAPNVHKNLLIPNDDAS